ncbi:MAG: GntR family transcriptional regulator, partial [Acidimicrobiia bacterium]|nr:GntR family transcriptional regulator [Acidimicrobiia bacterium]
MNPPPRGEARGDAKLAERVALAIRRDIVLDGWPVGRVVGAEPELVDRYGVSRAVLREAVRIVEYLGVGRMRQGPGGGLVITAPNPTAVTQAAIVYLSYAQVSLGEVIGARSMVEQLAVGLATERAAAAEVEALRERMAAHVEGPAHEYAPWRLHDEIAALTANPGIELFVKILGRITGRY